MPQKPKLITCTNNMSRCFTFQWPQPFERGFTLIELLLATLVILICAAAAVQMAGPLRETAVDAASNEVIQAIRFAQNEAIRAGSPRVVSIGTDNVVRVYQLSYATVPPKEDTANPVNHPLDKRSYSVTLSEVPFLRSKLITSAVFKFANSTTSSTLAFSANGEPVTVLGPTAADVSALVAVTGGAANVTLTSGTATRSITVDPISGRVTSL